MVLHVGRISSWSRAVRTRRVLPEVHICPAAKIRFIGNGIVLDRFLESVAPAVESTRPVVVMVSRLVREKGCDDFLEVARRLDGVADFVHVGSVEADQSDALGEAELAAAAHYVTFVGAVDDIRPYLAAADVVVQPSYREGIPRVVMEAAAVRHPRGRLRRQGGARGGRRRDRNARAPG